MTHPLRPNMPVPVFTRNHPDSYGGYPTSSMKPEVRYGQVGQRPSDRLRVEVSFPASGHHQQHGYSRPSGAAPGYGYPQDQGYGYQYRPPTPQRARYAAYGNLTEIRVSDPGWVERLSEAMSQGMDVDLVFDAADIVSELANVVVEQVGSFAEIARRRISSAIDEIFAAGLARPAPGVPMHALLAAPIVAAIIAAIVVVGLAIIYAVVAIYNANASRDIARYALEHGYELCNVETTSSGSGSDEGWFDFLNGSRWEVRRSC